MFTENNDLTLQNPTWFSLKETHKKWCLDFNGVKFYNPEICPFGAFINSSKTTDALNQYSKLTDSFFLVSENTNPKWNRNLIKLNKKIEGCQMVLENLSEVIISEEIKPLSDVYLNDIYELIWLVMPGYYRKQTFKMGDYFGIFKEKKLVSIAGQRMQTNNWIEISGVVTHPDYTRRGYAKQLTAHITKEIIKSGKHPILHTTKGNSAIRIYKDLGFKVTRDMNWWHFIKNKTP